MEYSKPIITADIIVLRKFNGNSGEILLIKRAKDPFKDMWALPGGHFDVDSDVSIKSAAERELKEETGIKCEVEYFTYVDTMGRDPRGRYVTFVYYCNLDHIPTRKQKIVAADDAKEARWFPIHMPDITLAYDHRQIIENYIRHYLFDSSSE